MNSGMAQMTARQSHDACHEIPVKLQPSKIKASSASTFTTTLFLRTENVRRGAAVSAFCPA